jgi:HEAT repeat protein
MAFVKKKHSETVPLEERRHGRDCPGLLAQLGDPDPAARRWAARDLLQYPETACQLVERLKLEPEASVRQVILTTLSRIGDPAAVAGLVECLRSEDAAVRNEVVEAMKQLPDEVAPIMQQLLTDTDPDVRIFTVNILESLRHPGVEAWLIEVIENDPQINVCATAVDLLGEVGTEAARGPLARLKNRFADDPYIQFATGLALKRIEGN